MYVDVMDIGFLCSLNAFVLTYIYAYDIFPHFSEYIRMENLAVRVGCLFLFSSEYAFLNFNTGIHNLSPSTNKIIAK